jgi:hypothetical protein
MDEIILTSLSRTQLLSYLPQHGCVAEVGVYSGGFANQILNRNKPSKLYLIDPWGKEGVKDQYVNTYNAKIQVLHDLYEQVTQMFSNQVIQGTVKIFREYSWESVEHFHNQYFDWVYIDAMHNYEGVLNDLRLFNSKIKDNGFIFGHDFSNTEMGRAKKFGVIQAVYEFIDETDWELVLVTNESAPSYLLIKTEQKENFYQNIVMKMIEAGSSLVAFNKNYFLEKFEQKRLVHPSGKKLEMFYFK